MFCTQAPDAAKLDHAVAVNALEPAPVALIERGALDFKDGLHGVAVLELVEVLHVVDQLVDAEVHHILEGGGGILEELRVVVLEIGPVEVGLAHEGVGGSLGHPAFLSGRGDERQVGDGLFAVGHDLLHDGGHGAPLEVDIFRRQARGDQRHWTEVAEQVEVVVGPQELGLGLVFVHHVRLDLRQVEQGVGPADADVSPAVNRVGHHVRVRVGEVVKLLPAGLVVVGRVTPGVGVVGTDVSVHDVADPLTVRHAPAEGVVDGDQGRGDLAFGLVIVAGEELVDGFDFEPVLAAGGQHERDSGEDGEVALKLVHDGRFRR